MREVRVGSPLEAAHSTRRAGCSIELGVGATAHTHDCECGMIVNEAFSFVMLESFYVIELLRLLVCVCVCEKSSRSRL